MSNFIDKMFEMHMPFNMVAVICLMFAIAGVITTVATQIRKYFSHREEIEFKRELLDRDMSVEEIERLIRARSKNSK